MTDRAAARRVPTLRQGGRQERMEPRPPRPRPPLDTSHWTEPAHSAPPADTRLPHAPFSHPSPAGGPTVPPGGSGGYGDGDHPASLAEVSPSGRRPRAVVGGVLALVLVLAVAGLAIWAFSRGGNNGDGAKAAAAATATRGAELAAVASAKAIMTADAPTKTPIPSPTPPPTATPTVTPIPTVLPTIPVTPTPKPTAVPTHSIPANLSDALPTAQDVPAGLVQSADGTRTLDQAASSFSDAADAATKLQAWGWQGNAYREFAAAGGATADVNGLTYLTVSIHRFGSPEAATEALAYFVNDVTGSSGFQTKPVQKIGDQTTLLVSQTQGTNVVLYIRRGPLLYRIGGFSPQGDPTGATIAIAKKVVSK